MRWGIVGALAMSLCMGCAGAPPKPPSSIAKPLPRWVRAAAVELGSLRSPRLGWVSAETLAITTLDHVVLVETPHQLVTRHQALDHLPEGEPTWILDAKGRWLLLYGAQALTLWDVLRWSPFASIPCSDLRCERGALLGVGAPVIELQWPRQQADAREWIALDEQTGERLWRAGRSRVVASAMNTRGQLLVARDDEVVSMNASTLSRSWEAQATALFIGEGAIAWLDGAQSLRICELDEPHRCSILHASADILDVRWANGSLWVAMTTGLARWIPKPQAPDGWVNAQTYPLDWASAAAWRDAQLKDGVLFVDDRRGGLRACSLNEHALELELIPLEPAGRFAAQSASRVWLLEASALVLYQR